MLGYYPVTDAQAQSGPFVSSLAGEERGKEAPQILLRTRRAIISKGSHRNIPDRFNSNSQGTLFYTPQSQNTRH